MQRNFLFASLPIITVAAIGLLGAQQRADNVSKLPGARLEIQAADYASLQEAIDALPAEGGVVRLPAGKFSISEPLLISGDDVLLAGQGTATHIENTNAEGKSALIIRPKTFESNKRDRIWRVQLENLRITGNEKSGHGINAYGVNEIFIHGVTVSYHGQDGIRLDQCYEDPRISDSLMTYNKRTGVALVGCHDIVVCGNQFEENQDALSCTDGFNLCMSGNNLDDHLRHGVVIENTYGSIVSSNMIEECQGTGIILDRDCYGITLSANVIAHEFTDGIDLRDAHGCTVSGNSFPIVHKRALVVGPQSDRIAITGNTFANTYIGEGKTKRPSMQDPSGGIVLSGTSDIAISGNVFADLVATKAIELDGPPSKRVVVDGNVFTGVESDHDKLEESKIGDNVLPAK
jgi:hypothetical protein